MTRVNISVNLLDGFLSMLQQWPLHQAGFPLLLQVEEKNPRVFSSILEFSRS